LGMNSSQCSWKLGLNMHESMLRHLVLHVANS
jgi:hypothetical protein